MAEKQFCIEGMTCSGCERTLENAVSRLEGVYKVQADRKSGRLRVCYGGPCTEEAIVRSVEKAGYHVAESSRRGSDGVYLLVILLGFYVIARQLSWTRFFQAVPTISGEQAGFAALFLIGLLTSVHCIAMCGGLNLAQSMSGEERHPLRRSFLYNLGRLTGYTLVGGVLGFVGEKASVTLQVRGFIGFAAGILMLFMGVCMLGGFSLPHGLRIPKPVERGLSALRKHGPFAIGLANAFMPCGPVQSMQLYAIASGSFFAGAASMFSFCLGTIPLVLLFGTAAGVLRMNWRKRMLQLGAALLVLMGLFTVQNNLALAGVMLPGAEKGQPVVAAVVDGGTQYVTTALRANGFDDIQVVAGIPVEWTITADKESLNGCNNEIVLSAFGQQVKLSEGANTITFTPEEPGEYLYSCWMGMLRSTITVVEEG